MEPLVVVLVVVVATERLDFIEVRELRRGTSEVAEGFLIWLEVEKPRGEPRFRSFRRTLIG